MKSLRLLVIGSIGHAVIALRNACKLTCESVSKFTEVAEKANNDFKLPIIEDVTKNNNFVKPGILPKKGGKKNKNVYYGRRY